MFAMENGLINALQAADCATNKKYRTYMYGNIARVLAAEGYKLLIELIMSVY